MNEVSYSDDVSFYIKEIDFYEKKFKAWEGRSDKIVKRYTDQREDSENNKSQFNILWSNTQTLAPAVYSQTPKPNIERRFQDDDELGLIASQVLERCCTYFLEADEFNYSMHQVTLDYLLSGRAQSWVRYVPEFEKVPMVDVGEENDQITEDIQEDDDYEDEELKYEDVAVDYVHWKDFGHSWARTWEEVRCVWRKVYMSKREVTERFGEDVAKSVDFTQEDSNGKVVRKKACIYELWDKVEGEVYWLCRQCPDKLDEMEDPLGLKGFFPCPKPIYSTVSNDNLIPTPFYVQYQDQAQELDELTARIQGVTGSIRVAGVYDSSVQGLESILSSGYDDKLVPVDSWAMFAEKGGLKGTIDFIPMQEIAQTLLSLYDARERVKQDLYEITGISDIVRGAGRANETATAQRIKGQFATLRLDSMQQEVQRFSRDLVRIIAEIIAEHFSPETIKQISGIKLLTEQEKQMIRMQMQQAQQMQNVQQQMQQGGQPLQQMQPIPPPPPEEVIKLMDKPTWEEVLGLIGNDMARCFRISVETDSTIKGDQEAEKQARIEFLTAASAFMEKTAMLPPDLQPLAGEMLMFGVRGFKTGREMEQTMKSALEGIRQKVKNPPPAQEDQSAKIAQQEAAAKYQEAQMRADADMKRAQAAQEKAGVDLQLKNADLEMKKIELAMKDKEIQIKRLELQAGALDTVEEQTLNTEVIRV